MATVLTLTLGSTTISLASGSIGASAGYGVPNDGNDLGEPGASPRQQTWLVWIKGSSKDDALARLNALERMLADARANALAGMGRTCTLSYQPDGATATTVFDVLGGRIGGLSPTAFQLLNRNLIGPMQLVLDVEPLARSAEMQAVTSGTLYARNGITHRYIHYSGASAFSENLAALLDGSMWQRTKFTTSPATATPQNGDIQYFGNTLAAFDRLIMGIRTARTGVLTAVWEYWNGAAWTTFVPSSDDFASADTATTAWDTVCHLGQIVFPTLTGFATTTINTVLAYWVRWRITTYTSMAQQPILTNGVNSLVGMAAIAAADVDGDVPSGALVHLTNPGATALAGVRAGVVTDRMAVGVPPRLVVSLSGADLAIASGDTTATVATDANATSGERVEVVPNASLSDRSQALDGSAQYISVAVSSGDKIDTLGATDGFVEVVFKLDTLTQSPTCLVSRWSGTAADCVFWLGVDQGKLRGLVYNSSVSRRAVNGSTALQVGVWYMATLEWDVDHERLKVKLNGVKEAEVDLKAAAVKTAETTALQVGRSAGYSSSDSRSGSASETYFDGVIGHVMLVANESTDWAYETLGAEHYEVPTVARVDSAEVRLLWQMNDNAGSTAIVDTAVTYAAAKNGARSAGNSSANTFPGLLQGGVSTLQQVVGIRLPLAYGQSYAGAYHVYLAARPEDSATLAAVSDVDLVLQFGIGDSSLAMQTVARQFPDTVPTSGGYFLLDMGVVQLPPAPLYEGHRSTISARQFLDCYVYLRHAFTVSTKKFYLDCLYFVPIDTWWAEWHAWRTTQKTAYEIAQNEGLLIDGRARELVVSPTTTSGYTIQDRDPYQLFRGDRPRLVPNRAAWLFGIPMRGVDSVVDHETRNIADSLTPRVHVMPAWRNLAAS